MAVQLIFQVMDLLFWLFNYLPFVIVEAKSVAKAGCDDQCGEVKIAYPFGMDSFSNCYLAESYRIYCDSNTPQMDINGIELEVTEISLGGLITVKYPILFQNCNRYLKSNNAILFDMEGSPFAFSAAANWFVAVDCNNLALLTKNESTVGGCMSICEESTSSAAFTDSSCSGVHCCHTTIPSDLKVFNVTLKVVDNGDNDQCKYA